MEEDVDGDANLDNAQLSQGKYTQLMQDMISLGSQGDPSLQTMTYMELLGVGVSNHIENSNEAQEGYDGTLKDFCHYDRGTCSYSNDINPNTSCENALFDDNPWGVGLFGNMEIAEADDPVANEDIPERAAPEPNENEDIPERAAPEPNENEDIPERAAPEPNENEDIPVANDSNEKEMLTEEDIEGFFEDERKKAEGDVETSISEELKPCMGMRFSSKEEGQNFFNFYSGVVGFSAAIVNAYRTTSKKRNNEITKVVMKCNKHGRTAEIERDQLVPQRKSTVITKTGCKVEMRITEKNNVWEVSRLHLEHNHELTPNSRFFRSHKYMSPEEQDLIRTLKYTNTPTGKVVDILAYVRGGIGCLPYTKKMVSNYGTQINKELQHNDMMEVVQMFNKKQAENPGFYYSFELDGENKVRSIFWSDQKSRLYYEQCGDCLSFDTTFLTNKYNLPFAPFVGVSPHGNTYLFACAFIVNETADTFRWLFRQFLTVMHGVPPVSIITDGDKGMKSAIDKVFPSAFHRWCLFHIKKKAEEKVPTTVFQANEGLYEDFQDIIDNSLTVEEFETLWQDMIRTYGVEHVEYFGTLWDKRQYWAPVYFKSRFFPFIQTTARSEGTNAIFKRGVGAKFSVTSFMREYQRILDTIHDREDECDHRSRNKKVAEDKYWSKLFIERQAHHFYNIGIFRKFQWVLQDITRLQLEEQEKEKTYLVFQSPNYPYKEHRPRYYLVLVDMLAHDFSCICCKFQKDGILCAHILKVMVHLNIPEIPEKYFIDRWRKKDKKVQLIKDLEIHGDNPALMFNVLSKRLVRTASTASKKKRKYQYLLQEIDRIEKTMAEMDNEDAQTTEPISLSTRTVTNVSSGNDGDATSSNIELLDPDVANPKGRPRMLTIKEAIKQKRFYTCGHCGSEKHTVKNCTNLHLHFDLPKRKRRKSNPMNKKRSDAGNKQKKCKKKETGAGANTSRKTKKDKGSASQSNVEVANEVVL